LSKPADLFVDLVSATLIGKTAAQVRVRDLPDQHLRIGNAVVSAKGLTHFEVHRDDIVVLPNFVASDAVRLVARDIDAYTIAHDCNGVGCWTVPMRCDPRTVDPSVRA
jgi:hypothetical protein